MSGRTLLVVAVLIGWLAACSETEPPPAMAEPAGPPGSVPLLDGGTLDPSALGGRWLFVNYWAEWCAPCLEEIPELNAFNEGDRVVVLGVNFDELPPEAMAPQVERLGIRFPVAANDAGEVLGIDRPEVLPSTYVFDPEGKRVGVLRGPQSLEQLHAAMGPDAG